jgi:hypothetical protein
MMNQLMADVITIETAALVRVLVTPDPTADLGWGSDLDCADDIDDQASELSGDDIRVLQQAIYHRLSTARGTLPGETEDEQNFGIDLLDLVAVGMDQGQIAEVQARIAGELGKDDRWDNVLAIVEQTDDETIEVTITAETITGVPFSAVIAVTDGETLLKVTG